MENKEKSIGIIAIVITISLVAIILTLGMVIKTIIPKIIIVAINSIKVKPRFILSPLSLYYI